MKYRGYQRCSRIDYADAQNAFAVTVCASSRRPVFVDDAVNRAVIDVIHNLNAEAWWTAHLYCIMPDHVHLIVSPGSEGLPHSVRRFKGRVSASTRPMRDDVGLWQTSFFDHLIRSSDSFSEKCQYVLQNPVRAGLCERVEDYPWCGILAVRHGGG